MTREPPQTLEGSAAGEPGGSPHLQALPGIPPSRARGLARHSQVGERPSIRTGSLGKPGSQEERFEAWVGGGQVRL